MTNLILIGCGPHAKRVYLPAIQRLSNAKISLIVELKGQESSVNQVIQQYGYSKTYFTEWFQDDMPPSLIEVLNTHIQAKNIQGVIIATEPLVHKVYALWALGRSLNILLDKPITTRENVVSDLNQAEGILQDYEELFIAYNKLQKKQNTVFIINSQRRFHRGFRFVRDKIQEVTKKTNCPINFIQAYHSDGQWRFPSEIVTQEYHPYCSGYGKASHSGYHIFDTALEFYKASVSKDKKATRFNIYSSLLQPKGFFEQLRKEDYDNLFADNLNHQERWDTKKVYEKCNDFGELDLSSIITLKKRGVAVANININLIHNGFAGRTWVKPGSDLYKGNGRIKHESYHIQQGPFQSIQIHSYQGSDQHDLDNGLEDYLGGKNHFDVYMYRNPMVSDGRPQPSVYNLTDLFEPPKEGTESNIIMEQVKFKVVEDFINFIEGRINKSEVLSQITNHKTSVQIMSGVYCSHIKAMKGDSPILSYPLD